MLVHWSFSITASVIQRKVTKCHGNGLIDPYTIVSSMGKDLYQIENRSKKKVLKQAVHSANLTADSSDTPGEQSSPLSSAAGSSSSPLSSVTVLCSCILLKRI